MPQDQKVHEFVIQQKLSQFKIFIILDIDFLILSLLLFVGFKLGSLFLHLSNLLYSYAIKLYLNHKINFINPFYKQTNKKVSFYQNNKRLTLKDLLLAAHKNIKKIKRFQTQNSANVNKSRDNQEIITEIDASLFIQMYLPHNNHYLIILIKHNRSIYQTM